MRQTGAAENQTKSDLLTVSGPYDLLRIEDLDTD